MQTVEVKTNGKQKRTTVSLNGLWECESDAFSLGIDGISGTFPSLIPVPGLWDMAQPPLSYTCDADTVQGRRGEYEKKAVWYRKKVSFGEIPESVVLKIHKGFYGKEIYVNGTFVTRHEPNFTPCYADIAPFLAAGENEILIKVGEKGTQDLSLGHPAGFDAEKKKYIPGLYDSVELIACGNPRIDYIQVAPDVKEGKVKVLVTLENVSSETIVDRVEICVADAEKTIAETAIDGVKLYPHEKIERCVELPMGNFHPWTPETPVLYVAGASTSGDEISARFGMRDFRFVDKIPTLNGKIYYLRGTNVVMFRFFEDEKRKALPWNEEWIRKVLLKFKSLNMNSLRFHIGFAPDVWYDLCDEIGILVDDEYALFGAFECPSPAYSINLLNEFKDWIAERANHPSVFLWDAQNEIANDPDNHYTIDTIPLIKGAKYTDLSGRPWDNGWDYPESDDCSIEVHPYLFLDSDFRLSDLNNVNKDPAMTWLCPDLHNLEARKEQNPFPANPRIVNEYSWLWISRDGKPCRLTKVLYDKIFPEGFTERELRDFYAKAVAALTEFWRSGRQVAGIMEFCGLSYSREGGETSDNFLPDIENPQYDPEFERRMFCAFAPVGISIDDYSGTMRPGEKTVDVILVNDTCETFARNVVLELFVNGKLILSRTEKVEVPGGARTIRPFTFSLDGFEKNSVCRLIARYSDQDGREIASEREFKIGLQNAKNLLGKRVISRQAKVEASSVAIPEDGRDLSPENVLKEEKSVLHADRPMWSSEFRDGQFILFDLGKTFFVSDISLSWENGAKEYSLLASDDKETWRTVYDFSGFEYGKIAYEIGVSARYFKLDLKTRLNKAFGFGIRHVDFYGEEIR